MWNKKDYSLNIGIWGLSISALGALISVFSLTPSDGRVTSPLSGIDYHLAVISDFGFKSGVYLLILGFLLQILEKISFRSKRQFYSVLLITILMSFLLYTTMVRYVPKVLFV